eukprot:15342260-Ditylum_brightwellii.AAC.1
MGYQQTQMSGNTKQTLKLLKGNVGFTSVGIFAVGDGGQRLAWSSLPGWMIPNATYHLCGKLNKKRM